MYAYFNDGCSFRAVDPESPDYKPETGEVLFPAIATPEELAASFPDYEAHVAQDNRIPLITEAQAALDKSDVTIVRCVSAQPPVAVPTAWTTFRAALRAIVNGSDTASTTLPDTPPYVEGT